MLMGFKDFIMKGNVVDLAVAVVIGASFGTVVNALVNSVLMPLIAKIFGVMNFDNFLAWGDVRFGVLLTAVVNFILVAAAIYFVVVVPMNHIIARRNARLYTKEEQPAVDPQIELLTEIRDSLRSRTQ
ncbi:large conductance mechanosensitive channel protein MscL [Paeniglutamicibacter antarcticus]|uniref:Large-conductance mechanosensitive channel n=1 Tax=Arthrobacter terrae TaxID=2935737 RepID=A0A931CQ14_9MICC|nr:large conductance mechanosensitive channel protein MscL [Arthrobacter terrae]MBG0740031.1 large conductance mechanosensitive channel protein MscL [Arthrobacter terrae]